jgi:hypothetical protein
MTKWAMLRAFDTFEPDWDDDARVIVSVMRDLSDRAARTA